ncbi:MAG: hypothetical protein HAW62_01160 [Endozoicomonadaceae bacterium]|nr:hypothetical protein [Endozoicomonadaceae bacterium]
MKFPFNVTVKNTESTILSISEAEQGTTKWIITSMPSVPFFLTNCLADTMICSNTEEEKQIFETALATLDTMHISN